MNLRFQSNCSWFRWAPSFVRNEIYFADNADMDESNVVKIKRIKLMFKLLKCRKSRRLAVACFEIFNLRKKKWYVKYEFSLLACWNELSTTDLVKCFLAPTPVFGSLCLGELLFFLSWYWKRWSWKKEGAARGEEWEREGGGREGGGRGDGGEGRRKIRKIWIIIII